MDNHRVTVIIVCYNHMQFLEESIFSVINQTYKNIELIVADDFSQDGSPDKLKLLSEKLNFIFLANETNIGLNDTILKTLEYASGSFISILAADDYLDTEKIYKQIKYLLEIKKDGVYANGYSVINGKKRKITINPVFAQNSKTKILNYIYQYDWEAPLLQSGLFRKNIVTDLIPIRKNFKSDDWAFLIKAYEEYEIGYMNEPLFFYRLHSTNSHRNYWLTFPMRIDIASRMVPAIYRIKTLSSIMASQGKYLLEDKKFFSACKFFISSLVLHVSFGNIEVMIKSTVLFFRNLFYKPAS